MALGDKTGRTAISRCCDAIAIEEFTTSSIGPKAAVATFLCQSCNKECRVFLNTINAQHSPLDNGASNENQVFTVG